MTQPSMPTSTVENYVKTIYAEQQALRADALVSLGRLASALDVVPGTVTTMIRTLDDAGLVAYKPRAGVRLTRRGEKLALAVLRRHRIVELFLVKILGCDWAEVHDEAEELEHVVSDKVLERMDALLGRPDVDPHGDPIPDASGRIEPRTASQPLVSFSAGDDVVIRRVVGHDAEFLRYLKSESLTPGSAVRVVKLDAVVGTITLRPRGAKGVVSLSLPAAGRLLAELDR
jgi:DtxR family transcriptional regulator, Mn-dependent transcriptional regulator